MVILAANFGSWVNRLSYDPCPKSTRESERHQRFHVNGWLQKVCRRIC